MKKRKLTFKQKGFIKDIVKGKTGTQAAVDNFKVKNRKSAQALASEYLSNPIIQKEIKSIADRIPDELLEKVHLEGLDAKYNKKPDYAVRHKYLDSAYKLKGNYSPDKLALTNVKGEDLLTPEDKERLLSLLK